MPDADHDYTRDAVNAIVVMARQQEYDLPGWISRVLASAAAELGSSAALVASRPGSWEAAALLDFVHSTAGYGDEYLSNYKLDGLSGGEPGA